MTTSSQLVISIEHLPPEGRDLEGRLPMADLHVSEDARVSCRHDLQFALHVSPVQGRILVRGRLSTVLDCSCDRCLDSFQLPIATEDCCHLVEEAAEGTVDLTEAVREDILLVFPQVCICRPDCRGLCPNCGRNLNAGTCSCPSSPVTDGPWDALNGVELSVGLGRQGRGGPDWDETGLARPGVAAEPRTGKQKPGEVV